MSVLRTGERAAWAATFQPTVAENSVAIGEFGSAPAASPASCFHPNAHFPAPTKHHGCGLTVCLQESHAEALPCEEMALQLVPSGVSRLR